MNIKSRTIKTLLVASIVITSITISCKKKSDSTTPTTPTGNLWFHLHSDATDSVQGSDYNPTPYTTVCDSVTGRILRVDTSQLLISNIQLINSSGGVFYTVPNQILFKVPLTEPYYVGKVPVGEFSAVRYYVGVDSAVNASVPNASDSALYNNTSMYYAGGSSPQSGGYTFIYFSGWIDTTKGATASASSNWNGTGTPPSGFAHFSYKIGGNKNLITVSLPLNNPLNASTGGEYIVTAGQTTFVHQIINYYKIFFNAGFPINVEANLNVSYSNPNPTITQKIISNIITGNGEGTPSSETWYYEQ